MLKNGVVPNLFLPIDAHIIEYSTLKKLIERVPAELAESKQEKKKPFLPIHPKSYRKQWQYDDEAYSFIYDYLSAFKEFNFPQELQKSLDNSRTKVVSEHTPPELFNFLLQSANKASFRRFQSIKLENIFLQKIAEWQAMKGEKQGGSALEMSGEIKGISTDDDEAQL